MAGEDHRFPLIPEIFDQLPNVGYAVLIQAIERLVQNEQARILHQCLRQPQALAHTQRIFSYGFAQAWIKAHQLNGVPNGMVIGDLPQGGQKLQILETGKVGQESRCFDDDADILRKVCFLPYLYMVDIDFALVRAKKAADALHKDGLAGAVVSNDAVDLAFFKGVGYVFQHLFFPKGFTDIQNFYAVVHIIPPFL